jgi:hydroxyacylglutathione hydrolase
MITNVYPLSLGQTNCFVLQGKGAVLIDTGPPKMAGKFSKLLSKTPVKPEDIGLIVITHGHFDHIGSARDIKEMTGARLAIHQNEKPWVEQAQINLPPGATNWGRILIGLFKPLIGLVKFPPTSVDITLTDDEFSLSEFGIDGRIVYTPGHSSGSMSVILDSGEAFIGDMAMSAFPMRIGPGLPIFAEDLPRLRESWKKVLGMGIKTIYPSHGKPFPADVMQQAVA